MTRIPSLIFALLLAALPVAAADYLIAAGDESNRVAFVSKAPMETVEGETRQVSGRVNVDLGDLAAGVELEVSVELATLDTGIGLRNKHMCENHLETEEYPLAVFEGATLKGAPASLGAGASADFDLTGELTLHGVTREITVPVTLTHARDGSLAVLGKFQVKLEDYKIKRPKFLVMKLDKVQRISLELVARPAAAKSPALN